MVIASGSIRIKEESPKASEVSEKKKSLSCSDVYPEKKKSPAVSHSFLNSARLELLSGKRSPSPTSGDDYNNPALIGFHDLVPDFEFSCPQFSHAARVWCEKQPRKAIEDSKAFTCKQCDKAFPIIGALRLHLLSHRASGNDNRCSQCDTVFSSPSALTNHIAQYHLPEEIVAANSAAQTKDDEAQSCVSQSQFLTVLGLRSNSHPLDSKLLRGSRKRSAENLKPSTHSPSDIIFYKSHVNWKPKTVMPGSSIRLLRSESGQMPCMAGSGHNSVMHESSQSVSSMTGLNHTSNTIGSGQRSWKVSERSDRTGSSESDLMFEVRTEGAYSPGPPPLCPLPDNGDEDLFSYPGSQPETNPEVFSDDESRDASDSSLSVLEASDTGAAEKRSYAGGEAQGVKGKSVELTAGMFTCKYCDEAFSNYREWKGKN